MIGHTKILFLFFSLNKTLFFPYLMLPTTLVAIVIDMTV